LNCFDSASQTKVLAVRYVLLEDGIPIPKGDTFEIEHVNDRGIVVKQQNRYVSMGSLVEKTILFEDKGLEKSKILNLGSLPTEKTDITRIRWKVLNRHLNICILK
jgi:hypothetical protein